MLNRQQSLTLANYSSANVAIVCLSFVLFETPCAPFTTFTALLNFEIVHRTVPAVKLEIGLLQAICGFNNSYRHAYW